MVSPDDQLGQVRLELDRVVTAGRLDYWADLTNSAQLRVVAAWYGVSSHEQEEPGLAVVALSLRNIAVQTEGGFENPSVSLVIKSDFDYAESKTIVKNKEKGEQMATDEEFLLVVDTARPELHFTVREGNTMAELAKRTVRLGEWGLKGEEQVTRHLLLGTDQVRTSQLILSDYFSSVRVENIGGNHPLIEFPPWHSNCETATGQPAGDPGH